MIVRLPGRRAHRVRRVSTTMALVVTALLALPGVLLAHARLTKSAPAAGAKLVTSPTSIRLWFSEAPEVAFTKVTLFGPDSTEVTLGPVQREPNEPLSVAVPIATALAPGQYTVVWRTAASDGHPSHGRFGFAVLPSSPPAMGRPTPAGPPAARMHEQMMQQHTEGMRHAMGAIDDEGLGVESVAYVAARWLSFTALISLIGVVAFRSLLLPLAGRTADANGRGDTLRQAHPTLVRRAALLGVIATAALLAGALARLYVQSSAIHGAAEAMNMGMMSEMVTKTTWGSAWLVQSVAAIVALVALATAVAGVGVLAWVITTAAVLVLAFTPALGGHAAAAPRLSTLAVIADGLHVLGAGGWLGALLVMLVVGVPVVLAAESVESAHRGGLVADFVNAFSPTALVFASLVVLTGVFAAWLHLGSIAALWNSSYGQTLLIKLALLVPVLGTGAYNWLRVRPALGDVQAAARLHRSGAVELVVGTLVIAATAVLVALQTPR